MYVHTHTHFILQSLEQPLKKYHIYTYIYIYVYIYIYICNMAKKPKIK